MVNIWEPLPELVHGYHAQRHPITGPLIRGGPARLATEYGLAMSDAYVDECHLCYSARKLLMERLQQYLAPKNPMGCK